MTLVAGGDIRFRSRLIEGVEGNGMQQTEHYLLDGRLVFLNALDSASLTTDQYGSDEESEYDLIGDSGLRPARKLTRRLQNE